MQVRLACKGDPNNFVLNVSIIELILVIRETLTVPHLVQKWAMTLEDKH